MLNDFEKRTAEAGVNMLVLRTLIATVSDLTRGKGVELPAMLRQSLEEPLDGKDSAESQDFLAEMHGYMKDYLEALLKAPSLGTR